MKCSCRIFLPVVAAFLALPTVMPADYYAVKRIAGRPAEPVANGTSATAALLGQPVGVAVDSQQKIYISDSQHQCVYRVDGGKVSVLAKVDGPGAIAVDRAGSVYVVSNWVKVLRIASDGTASPFAGSGVWADGPDGKKATETAFSGLTNLAIDSQNRLWVVDQNAWKIRRIETDGTVKTIAGNGAPGNSADGAPAAGSSLAVPQAVAFLPSGEALISEYLSGKIRKITADGKLGTFATGLAWPSGMAWTATGEVYAIEQGRQVRAIGPDGTLKAMILDRAGLTALASYPAGGVVAASSIKRDIVRAAATGGDAVPVVGAPHFGGDGGPAVSALLDAPVAVVADTSGNVYISDAGNHRVRRVTAAGAIETYAGTGQVGYNGDGKAPTSTNMDSFGLAVDPDGGLYVADLTAERIRLIPRGGSVRTVAGNGGTSGWGAWTAGPALTTELGAPMGLTRAANGALFVGYYKGLKRITPDGMMSVLTLSGWGSGNESYVFLNGISLATDSTGAVWISDSSQISRVTGAGKAEYAVIGNGGQGLAGGVATDEKDNLYFTYSQMNYIGRRTPQAYISRFIGGGSAKPGDLTVADETDLSGINSLSYLPGGDLLFTIGDSVYRAFLVTPATMRVSGGDGQKGYLGATLATPLSVAVSGPYNLPMPGTRVAFAVTRGEATLSAATATTDTKGNASVEITLGAAEGTVTVTATVAGVAPVTFQLSAESLLYQPPASGGSTGAAEYTLSTAAGTVASARLDYPTGLAFGPSGRMYVAERGANRLRSVAADGATSIVVSQGLDAPASVAVDGNETVYAIDQAGSRLVSADASGGVQALTKLSGAGGMAMDRMGRVFVAEASARHVSVWFPSTGTLGVFAGEGGPESTAGIVAPYLVAVNSDFAAYIADAGARTVWRVSESGAKSAYIARDAGAALDDLAGLAVDARGVLFLAERGGAIYRAGDDGALTRVADAPGAIAGMALDSSGAICVSLATDETVVRLDAGGAWKLLAGASHFSGDGGPASDAGLNRPAGVTPGNGGYYIADTGNGRVRFVDAGGTISTVAGGGAQAPPADGSAMKASDARFTPISVVPTSDGGAYINAGSQILWMDGKGWLRLARDLGDSRAEGGMARDTEGRLVFADRARGRVVRLAPSGEVEMAGACEEARAVAADARGYVYASCRDRVYRVEGDGTRRVVTAAAKAAGMTFDEAGALLIAEGNAVRRYAPPTAMRTIAGSVAAGFAGDGGLATEGLLNAPAQVTAMPNGDLLVADTLNHRIRRLTPVR